MRGCVLDADGPDHCITYFTNVDQGLLMVRTTELSRKHADRVAMSVVRV